MLRLRVGLYRPGRFAERISCPWLVCVADRDVVTPPQPAVAAALRAPRGELRRYDAGHFDVYRGELYEQVMSDQLGFLARNGLTDALTQPAATPPQPAGQPGR